MIKLKRWLKWIFISCVSLFALILLAVTITVYLLNSESYIEKQILQQLGVESTIGDLDVSLLKGTVKVGASKLGPTGSKGVAFKKLSARFSYKDIWNKRLLIESIELDGATISYPFSFELTQATTSTEQSEDLFFEALDIADIQINDFEFEYQDQAMLKGSDINLSINNLPIIEKGISVFANLEHFFEIGASQFNVQIGQLEYEKSQLNQLELQASIKQKSILVEQVTADSAQINIEIEAPEVKAASVNEQLVSFTMPFEQLLVENIFIAKTDLELTGQQQVKLNQLGLKLNSLLLVKNKQALWTDFPKMLAQQSNQLQLSSNQLQSEQLSFKSLQLQASLQNQQISLHELNIEEPSLDLTNNGTVDSKTSTSQAPLLLPFQSLLIEQSKIDGASIKIKHQGQPHQLSELDLVIRQLPVVVKEKLISDAPLIKSLHSNASLLINNAAYQGDFGSIDKLSAQIELQGSDLIVKTMQLSQADITITEDTLQAGKQKEDVSEVELKESLLPFSQFRVEEFELSQSDFEFNDSNDKYSIAGLDLSVKNLPLIKQQALVGSDFSQWDEPFELDLSGRSIKFSDNELSGLEFSVKIDEESMIVSPLRLSAANLSFDAATEQANSSSSISSKLDLKSGQIQDLQLNDLSIIYRDGEQSYAVKGADLKLSRLPLIANYQLLTDSKKILKRLNTSYQISMDELLIPQGKVKALSSNGRVKSSNLQVSDFSTNFADLKIQVAASESSVELAQKQSQNAIEKPSSQEPFVLNSLQVENLQLKNSQLQIEQQKIVQESEPQTEVTRIKGLRLGATNLQLVKDGKLINDWYQSELGQAFSLLALQVDSVEQQHNRYQQIKATAFKNGNNIKFSPLEALINNTPVSINWNIDLEQSPYLSTLDSQLSNIDLSDLIVPETSESIGLQGKVDASLQLSFKGLDQTTIISSLNGLVNLSNKQPLKLTNINVNKILRHFLESQNFGLLDIGGFLLAGPAGLLLSQGVSFEGVLSNLGAGEGDTLISDIQLLASIENGILNTEDVAMATEQYRFAFNGQVDLQKQQFKDFAFDILSEKGCSEYGQTLNGDLASPDIQTLSAAFDALTGSVVGLLKDGVSLLSGGSCKQVYQGKVAHPSEAAEIIWQLPEPTEPAEELESVEPLEEPAKKIQ